MPSYRRPLLALTLLAAAAAACTPEPAPPPAAAAQAPAPFSPAEMSFFVSSTGSGKGADLAGWPAGINCASRWPRPPAPVRKPGTPI